MSWLYGQTWLWYLIAVLVGVVLAWLFLVRPQQRRLDAVRSRATGAGAVSMQKAGSGDTADPKPAAAAAGVGGAALAAAATAATTPAEPVTEEFEPVTEQFEPVTEQIPAVDPALSTLDSATLAQHDGQYDDTVVVGRVPDGPPDEQTVDIRPDDDPDTDTVVTGRRPDAPLDEQTVDIRPDDDPTVDITPSDGGGTPTGTDDAAGPAATAALGIAGRATAGTVGTGGSGAPTDTPYGPGSAHPAADGSSPHLDYTLATPAPTFEPGNYPGSAKPRSDGSAPTDAFTIKGNEDSKLYHLPSSPYYGRTRAEVWFSNEADAEAAGFTQYRRK